MKLRNLLWFLPLLLLLSACNDPYGACVKADADIAQAISTGMKTVTQLEQQGTITPTEAMNVAGYLEYANQADEAFGLCAQEAHQAGSKTGSFTACVQVFNTTLNNPTELALIKVNNPTASQNISIVVNGITTAATAISAALGGA